MIKDRISDDGMFAISQKGNALLQLPQSVFSSGKQKGAAKNIKDNDVTKHGAQEHARWGSNNLYPQDFYKDVKKHTITMSGLNFKAKALASQMQYGTVEYDDNGEELFIPVKDKVIETFIRKTRLYQTYLF